METHDHSYQSPLPVSLPGPSRRLFELVIPLSFINHIIINDFNIVINLQSTFVPHFEELELELLCLFDAIDVRKSAASVSL